MPTNSSQASSASPEAVSAIEDICEGRIKFYLLQTSGPMSYTLRENEGETQYKVLLGDPNRCSCGNKEKAGVSFVPCSHVLFVLLRVLRVQAESKVCWQPGLSERDIEHVLLAQSLRRENASAAALDDGALARRKHKFLRKRTGGNRRPGRRGGSSNQESDDEMENEEDESRFDFVPRKPVEEDDVCPICQEDLPMEAEKVDRLAFCRISCGNSLHVKCMKIWAEHQSSIGNAVSCPLCRVSWGTFALQELKRAERKVRSERALAQKRQSTHVGAQCRACRACPVVGQRFRCLICPNKTDLCSTCYHNRTDVQCKSKLHPFVVKNYVLAESGAELLGASRPSPNLLDDIEMSKANAGGPLAACVPCLRVPRSEAKLARIIHSNEIYVVTSNAAFTLLDKSTLAPLVERAFGPNTPEVERVASLPEIRRVMFSEMLSCERQTREGVKCVVVQGSAGPKSDLCWLVEDQTLVIMVESAHHELMDAAMLATMPKGMLENRIATE